MAGKELPRYTKVDSNGKEIIYWNALGTCGHIVLFEIQSFKGDFIFCQRCNDFREVVLAKYMRPESFIDKHGGALIA
jgi:hypothetical protein